METVTKDEARRFLGRFEAIDEANRLARLRQGPDAERSVRLSLAIREFAGACERSDTVRRSREAGVEAVRETWGRLHRALGHAR